MEPSCLTVTPDSSREGVPWAVGLPALAPVGAAPAGMPARVLAPVPAQPASAAKARSETRASSTDHRDRMAPEPARAPINVIGRPRESASSLQVAQRLGRG